jgi:hypothetical protein
MIKPFHLESKYIKILLLMKAKKNIYIVKALMNNLYICIKDILDYFNQL